MGRPMSAELSGFTVGVTADRRRDALGTLLERRGARVVLAPALRIVPLADDTELRAATRACLDRPPDIVVANTSIGMRGWLEAADGWGLAEPLRGVLAQAYMVDPRSPGTRRARRRPPRPWSPVEESYAEVIDHLRGRGVRGQVVAMQLPGERAARVDRRAGGRRRHRDRDTGLPLGAAARPGPAAPDGRPGHRPAGRRGHLHLRPRGQRAAPRGRARPATTCWTRCAPTCWPPAWARSPRRRCAGTACPWSRPAGPGWARWSARSSRNCRRGRSRSGWPATTSRCAGHAAVVDGALKTLAPAPMAVLRALAADARPGPLPGRPAAHPAAGRRRARRGDGGGPAARRLGYP